MGERPLLGDMLVTAGLVAQAQVDAALAEQQGTAERLGQILVRLRWISEVQLTQALSNQLTIPWVNLTHVDFSRELLELIPSALAADYHLIPVYVRHLRRQGRTLYVAMDDPLNHEALQKVADYAGLPVRPMVAPPTDIRNAIRVFYLGLSPLDEEEGGFQGEESDDEPEISILDDAQEMESTPVLSDELPTFRDALREQDDASALDDLTGSSDERALDEGRPEVSGESGVAPVDSMDDTANSDEASSDLVVVPSASAEASTEAASMFADTHADVFRTLTLLDGTTVRLPSGRPPASDEEDALVASERRVTTRDIIRALLARAEGHDVSEVLPEDAWESLMATLLSLLLRKGLVTDWEFVDEWQKHRK